jgi:hypothetical protein
MTLLHDEHLGNINAEQLSAYHKIVGAVDNGK